MTSIDAVEVTEKPEFLLREVTGARQQLQQNPRSRLNTAFSIQSGPLLERMPTPMSLCNFSGQTSHHMALLLCCSNLCKCLVSNELKHIVVNLQGHSYNSARFITCRHVYQASGITAFTIDRG